MWHSSGPKAWLWDSLGSKGRKVLWILSMASNGNQWRFIAFFPRPRTTSLLGSRNLFECCFPVINGNILPHSHNIVFICLLPSGHRWIMIIYAYAVHTHTVYTIHRYTIPYSFCFADIIKLCIHVRSWLIYMLSVTSCFYDKHTHVTYYIYIYTWSIIE